MTAPRSGFAEQFYTQEPEPRIRKRYRFLAKTVGLGLGLWGLATGCNALVGEAGTPVPRKVVAAELKDQAKRDLSSMSDIDQFQAMYVEPLSVVKFFKTQGGSGVRKGLKLKYKVTVGQDCLAPTAYNTTPSEIRTWTGGGDISPGAILFPEGDQVVVKVGASDEGRLVFDRVGGLITPNTTTASILVSNGCLAPGIPMTDVLNNLPAKYETPINVG